MMIYRPGTSLLHHLHPLTKLAIVAMLGMTVSLFHTLWLAPLIFALLLLAAWFTAPIAVDVGERDLRFTADFHDPETFATSLARWTSDRSLLLLPRSARVAPYSAATSLRRTEFEEFAEPTMITRSHSGEIDLMAACRLEVA